MSRDARDQRLTLALIAAALTTLYLLRLATVSHLAGTGVGLHVDEAQYWDWSRDLAWGYYSKPPVIAALIAASTAVLGDTVLGVKALTMLCHPLTALVMALFVRDALQDRAGVAPVAAAVLTATMPLAGLLGLAATTDAPLMLSWSLALWALVRAVRAPSWRAWVTLGLVCGVGLLSKYTMAAFALTAAGFVLHMALTRAVSTERMADAVRGLVGLVAAGLVGLLVLAPNLLWNAAHDWPTLKHTADITTEAGRPQGSVWWSSLGAFLGGQALILGPLTVAFAIWLALKVREQGPSAPQAVAGNFEAELALRRLALWAAIPLLGVGALQAARAQAEVNWAAPALLGLIMWVSVACARVEAKRPWAVRRWLVACALTHATLAFGLALAPVLATALGRSLPSHLDLWARMRGWDTAFASLEPLVRARMSQGPEGAHGQAVTVVALSRGLNAQGAWAWRDLPVQWRAWSHDGQVHHHYHLTKGWPGQGAADQGSAPVLMLAEGAALDPILGQHFTALVPLLHVKVPVNARRSVELAMWEARGPVPGLGGKRE